MVEENTQADSVEVDSSTANRRGDAERTRQKMLLTTMALGAVAALPPMVLDAERPGGVPKLRKRAHGKHKKRRQRMAKASRKRNR